MQRQLVAQVHPSNLAQNFDRAHVRNDWQHYIELVDRKPGALRNGAPVR